MRKKTIHGDGYHDATTRERATPRLDEVHPLAQSRALEPSLPGLEVERALTGGDVRRGVAQSLAIWAVERQPLADFLWV